MPSNQILSRIGAALILAAGSASAAYTLTDSYDHTNFFSEFSFFSGPDPTSGLVAYQPAVEASKSSLAGYTNNADLKSVYLGVDHTTKLSGTAGRASTRVSSNKAYTHGLFIADVAHMPEGCGTWPALWSFGPDWPSRGEIDVIEGVNAGTTNQMTLHTSKDCIISNSGSDAGTTHVDANCNAGEGKTGCGQTTKNTQNYGAGFNANGGGVYAWEWTSSYIAIYFFPRTAIPANIQSGKPDPTTWGTPTAKFAGSGCNIDDHFSEHSIILDTTFCGDWAGQVWSSGGCAASTKAATCNAYVSANPTAFNNAYWIINSIKVFSSGATKRDATHVSFKA
ncbi:hypothetical protein SBOR_6531 [Sclerotinia borealis F-4128]|uniref:endo-1,3(4)-beta-glucanase n=1 Tax=Sclerotinia borealis (strain F-4128) TaxID=1432307 RepID=W9CB74_SCLBF|nr:hypothetical protein SBOR_6531 [Sclerotinia borealis F-4128]